MRRKKVIYAQPCYGPLDPHIVKSGRDSIMAARDVEWIGDASPIRQGWVAARNAVAKAAVECDADAVAWHDDDVLLHPDTFARLLRYDEGMVTGVLFQKSKPFFPLLFNWGRDKDGFSPFESWPANVLLPVDGCGFGVCVTSTDLLRKIQALPNFETDGWFNQLPSPRGMYFSEDFSFCLRAKEAGVQIYCDTAVLASHQIGPAYATAENHGAAAESRKELI